MVLGDLAAVLTHVVGNCADSGHPCLSAFLAQLRTLQQFRESGLAFGLNLRLLRISAFPPGCTTEPCRRLGKASSVSGFRESRSLSRLAVAVLADGAGAPRALIAASNQASVVPLGVRGRVATQRTHPRSHPPVGGPRCCNAVDLERVLPGWRRASQPYPRSRSPYRDNAGVEAIT